jgi:hypothetical protein
MERSASRFDEYCVPGSIPKCTRENFGQWVTAFAKQYGAWHVPYATVELDSAWMHSYLSRVGVKEALGRIADRHGDVNWICATIGLHAQHETYNRELRAKTRRQHRERQKLARALQYCADALAGAGIFSFETLTWIIDPERDVPHLRQAAALLRSKKMGFIAEEFASIHIAGKKGRTPYTLYETCLNDVNEALKSSTGLNMDAEVQVLLTAAFEYSVEPSSVTRRRQRSAKPPQ